MAMLDHTVYMISKIFTQKINIEQGEAECNIAFLHPINTILDSLPSNICCNIFSTQNIPIFWAFDSSAFGPF